MKNFLSNNTGLLIRVDDIAENMNWKFMDQCELLFDKFNIKPLLGIIPENKDKELLKFPKNSNFWKRVHSWKEKNWEISMHGFNHVYDNETKFSDFFKYGGPSEFCGHEYSHQYKKIKMGKERLLSEGILIKSFFAPNHTYDSNTFKALFENDIKIVIDGYGLFPYKDHNLTFIPQLFYKEIMLPFGIQSTQIHMNYWDENHFQKFKKFIEINRNKIKNFDELIKKSSDNKSTKIIRDLIKLTLINIRKFKHR